MIYHREDHLWTDFCKSGNFHNNCVLTANDSQNQQNCLVLLFNKNVGFISQDLLRARRVEQILNYNSFKLIRDSWVFLGQKQY